MDASITHVIGIAALRDDRKALGKGSVPRPLKSFLVQVERLTGSRFEEMRRWEFGGCSIDQLSKSGVTVARRSGARATAAG